MSLRLRFTPLIPCTFALLACGGAITDPSGNGGTTGSGGTDGGIIDTGTGSVFDGGSGGWSNRTQGTSASGQLWTAVASDASGQHLVAATTLVIPPGHFVDGVWTSSDGSATWTLSSDGPVGLASVASNANGTVLVAAEGTGDSGGSVWTSTSSGASWSDATSPALSHSWGSVASDSSGTHLVAAGASQGDIWTSSDSGATWVDRTPSGPAHDQNWVSLASDATGTRLVAAAGGGHAVAGPGSTGDLWTSSDGGATWTDETPSGPAHDIYWAAVASDSTGTNLVAVGSGIFTSVDAGQTWTQQAAPVTSTWVSVASDSSGTRLVAASGAIGGTGDLWVSLDSGVTWLDQTSGTAAANQPWSAVASDATGAHLVAVVSGGDVWTN